jgi:hypothetical protein
MFDRRQSNLKALLLRRRSSSFIDANMEKAYQLSTGACLLAVILDAIANGCVVINGSMYLCKPSDIVQSLFAKGIFWICSFEQTLP